MNRVQKALMRRIPAWSLLVLVVAIAAGVYLTGDWSLCDNAVHSDLRSPDGRFHAVLFTRGCGATTGDSLQLSLLPVQEGLPNEGGNVFTFSEHFPAEVRGPTATVAWVAKDTLEVRYDPRGPLNRFLPPEHITVRYIPITNRGA